MAEALSVAGTIAGLLGIADVVVRRVVTFAKDVKHAKEEVKSLLEELSGLLGLLHSLQYLAKEYQKEELDAKYQGEHLQACRTTLSKLKEKLERADPS
jgi:mRNA-degrading endonuclease YafQ of YafQ-DinJ toxin-antitoxin module